MPVVTIDWWSGSSAAARARTVRQVTDAVAEGAGCPHEAVTVILRETDPSFWARGGELAGPAPDEPAAGTAGPTA
ncbi:tautomerase family protein [Streptomyces niger]|uniref:tautomerase family protein n=1 Tax=Streptomyces niger TaxID=66373 RepID=UPI00069CB09F|nr:tautomerase family protein [Streptomyces niger]